MKKSRSYSDPSLFSPRASLAALAVNLRSLNLFDIIAQHVVIQQKTIKHSPIDKLTDAFIAILSGARGLCEINTRVRTDKAVQRAFGRNDCAEQSVVQQTLDACTPENVSQLEQAIDEILRTHSRAFSHDYDRALQLIDIDLTGMTCGQKAERATKGYFRYRGKYGRQMGRVLAALYGEVVVDRLYAGNVQLNTKLIELVEAMEKTLQLDEARRKRTVLRIDAGGGSLDAINWLLRRGYQIHLMDYSSRRAAKFSKYVREWTDNAIYSGRQLGWVSVKSVGYARQVRQLLMGYRKKNGHTAYRMLLTTLEPNEVLTLLGRVAELDQPAATVITSYAELYDLRGGTVEIEFKQDKQGIGIAKRNKKRFAAQQVVMMLGTLAHNVLVWSKQRIVKQAPKLSGYGVQRIVRDVLTVSGKVELDKEGAIKKIVLSGASALAWQCIKSLKALLKPKHVVIILGEI